MDGFMDEVCTECLSELSDGERLPEEVRTGPDCRLCGDPSCDHHGTEYRRGWEHEMCHEAPDTSREDD